MAKLTIGRLAGRVGMRTSALRYYEEQGLLFPAERSDSGYRLYDPEAEQTLRFIQQAQRLGFSLADIRSLLHEVQQGTLSDETVVTIAEERLLALERHLTELLVVHHEMESFVSELRRAVHRDSASTESFFDRMIGTVCARPPDQLEADSILDWLIAQTHCGLGLADAQAALDALRGQHVHIWEEDGAYQILVVNQDPGVESALRTLAQLEADCHAHASPQLERHREGLLFTATGENAFIFARLFLALERA
jgi:DNA-binding transcriptional MerR regulator